MKRLNYLLRKQERFQEQVRSSDGLSDCIDKELKQLETEQKEAEEQRTPNPLIEWLSGKNVT
jgi:hypothetical protein